MGTKTKNSSNANIKQYKKIADHDMRLKFLEESSFHGLLRSEALIQILLEKELITQTELEEHIRSIFDKSREGIKRLEAEAEGNANELEEKLETTDLE